MHEHHLASGSNFGQVDFRSHLPEWQVAILTKVTPCSYCKFVYFPFRVSAKALWSIYSQTIQVSIQEINSGQSKGKITVDSRYYDFCFNEILLITIPNLYSNHTKQ